MTTQDPQPPAAPAPSPPPAKAGPPAEAPSPEPARVEAPPPDWESQFKYLLADFENYRRRADKERDQIRLRAEADVLRALLPIHEGFRRAHESLGRGPKTDPVRKGMELLAHEWEAFMKREEVRPLASPGDRFDPDSHEAVAEAPAGPATPVGTIVEVVQQGYRFRGGLLRTAKVAVARAPARTGPTPASAVPPETAAAKGPPSK